MIKETIRNRLKGKNHSEEQIQAIKGYTEYLKPFSEEGRELNEILLSVKFKTLEFVCFHKNWLDVTHFKDIENWNKQGPQLYK